MFRKIKQNVALFAALLSFAVVSGKDPLPEVVAKINDTVISKDDLVARLIEMHGFAALESLINEKIIEVSLAKRNLSPVTDEQVALHISQMEKHLQRMQGPYASIETFLKNQEMSLATLQRKTRREIGLRRILGDAVNAHDKEIELFYNENKRFYTTPDAREIVDVVIFDRFSPAPTGLQTERSPEEAELLANEFREAVLKNPGHLDKVWTDKQYFIRGYKEPFAVPVKFADKPEYKEVFAGKLGSWTPVVKDKAGYHIYLLKADLKAGVIPLAEIKEDVRDQVYVQKITKMLQEGAFEKLKSDFTIDRLIKLEQEK